LIGVVIITTTGCGDPLVDGAYRGEPVGRISALLQSYQPLQSYTEGDWVSVESQCLDQSDSCLLSETSPACRVEQNQCIQETRADVSWMQDPAEISLTVLWLPISSQRGDNGVDTYLKTHDQLPQSALLREFPSNPFPYQGKLILYQPPPDDFLTTIDLTQQAHLASASELSNTPTALGVVLAYLDEDDDQSYTYEDTLVGLTLDQGIIYAKLPNNLSSSSLKLLGISAQPRAITSALLSRVNFPFCSTPEQWVLPESSSLPLTLSLMELQSWVLDDELDRYFNCEAGVSPQCSTQQDLDEICAPTYGGSELCAQCFDQVINDLCGQVMAKCVETFDDWDHTCFTLSEACHLRANCFQFDMYCEWTSDMSSDEIYWMCGPEDTTFCYQDSSCIIQTLYDEELVDGLIIQDEVDPYEYTELEADEIYQNCISDDYYAQWIRDHPTCENPLGTDLSHEEPDKDNECFFKDCERTYIFCDGIYCEDEYIQCVLMR